MNDGSPRFPNKLLVMGVSFALVGALLMLWTSGYFEGLGALWPIVPVIGGLLLLYLHVYRGGHDYYIFLGSSLFLAGLLLLLTTTVLPTSLERVWPILMTIVGLSLLFYGAKKEGLARVSLVIPAIAMILLSVLFVPFSLGIVRVSFTEFVGRWWPLLFVVIGIGLAVAHFLKQPSE
jgi:hypothetical protein